MKKSLYLFFTLVFIMSLDAKDSDKNTTAERLVWPKVDEARIEYIASINTADGLGIEKSFFTKFYDFIFGESDLTLSAPFGIHADLNRVYVTDIASKLVYVFDKSENETIVLEGSKDQRFSYPIDVVSSPDGLIYVSDSVLGKIFAFQGNGDYSFTVDFEELKRPIGLAISADLKYLYIVDVASDSLHVTTLKGKYIKSIGQRGSGEVEFNKPTYIDVGKDGDIYITDSMNHRIHVLDKDGGFVRYFGKLSQNIGGFANPRGISLDSDDNVYVGDTMYNTVQMFNKYGEVLMRFGNYGDGRGEFALLEDISIIEGNIIYIADVNNKCIKIFKRLDPVESK